MRRVHYLGFSLIILFICMLIQNIHLSWLADGKLVIIADADIQQTADYLYQNPMPTPVEFGFEIKPGSLIENDVYFCVSIYNKIGWFAHRWSKWKINGVSIPQWMYNVNNVNRVLVDDSEPVTLSCLTFNVVRWLYPGIHLFELTFKENPFDPGISYQWAIKIEPTGIPTPSATPSAP